MLATVLQYQGISEGCLFACDDGEENLKGILVTALPGCDRWIQPASDPGQVEDSVQELLSSFLIIDSAETQAFHMSTCLHVF